MLDGVREAGASPVEVNRWQDAGSVVCLPPEVWLQVQRGIEEKRRERETNPAVFNEALTRTDALYFTITVFATVGFGDIAPVAQWMRVVVSLQMVADLLVLGFVLRAVVDAVGRARSRQSG